MNLPTLLCLPALLLATHLSVANENDPHAEDRAQLRAILAESERGINEQSIDLLAKNVDESTRVTWLNGEVSVGPEGVRNYFKRMVGNDPNAILSRYKTRASVTGTARFYGDTAVANGTMEDEFTPHHRGKFNFHSYWTATFFKKNNQWKIISLNFSTNAFNNELTTELRQYAIYTGIGGFLLGILLTVLWCRWQCRHATQRQAS